MTEANEALETAFDALSDPDCRAILASVDDPMTTSEIADACDLALSTAYRKVEQLNATPFLTEGIRFDPDGDHAAEYSRGVSEATVSLSDSGILLAVETDEAASSSFDTVGISAD
jgi:DNA-binding transcriptional ArsR family regulator